MTKELTTERTGGFGRWRVAGWSLAAMLMLLPLAAMQVSDEVNWTASDFVFAGALIGSVGLLVEVTVRTMPDPFYRLGACLLLAAAFLFTWLNAAVCMIGNEDNPLNLLYAGVLAIALAGAIGAGFRPRGMARASIATAIAQLLVAAIAVSAGGNEAPEPAGLAMLNGFFVLLLVATAWRFGRSASA